MHPFYSSCSSRLLQVYRMELVLSMMLAIFQLPVQARERNVP